MREQKKNIYNKVLYCLEIEQVFLKPSFSLTEFSAMVGTNTTYLSNTINDCFKCNFNVLINQYRVEYSKQLLVDDTVMLSDIPQMSGFTSRSAFYAAFSKIEGTSPLIYRQVCKLLQKKKRRRSIDNDQPSTKKRNSQEDFSAERKDIFSNEDM